MQINLTWLALFILFCFVIVACLFVCIFVCLLVALICCRCKGKEFSLGCSANSTWLPQVELECRQCQGEACEGAEPSEFFISK